MGRGDLSIECRALACHLLLPFGLLPFGLLPELLPPLVEVHETPPEDRVLAAGADSPRWLGPCSARDRIAPQSEVIRAILLEHSP